MRRRGGGEEEEKDENEMEERLVRSSKIKCGMYMHTPLIWVDRLVDRSQEEG